MKFTEFVEIRVSGDSKNLKKRNGFRLKVLLKVFFFLILIAINA